MIGEGGESPPQCRYGNPKPRKVRIPNMNHVSRAGIKKTHHQCLLQRLLLARSFYFKKNAKKTIQNYIYFKYHSTFVFLYTLQYPEKHPGSRTKFKENRDSHKTCFE